MNEPQDLVRQVHEAAACGETETVQRLLREHDLLTCVSEVTET